MALSASDFIDSFSESEYSLAADCLSFELSDDSSELSLSRAANSFSNSAFFCSNSLLISLLSELSTCSVSCRELSAV